MIAFQQKHMVHLTAIVTVCCVLCLGNQAAFAQEDAKLTDAVSKASKPKLAIKVGKIITSAGKPIVNGTILVSKGKIEAIGKSDQVKIPDGYEVIDHSDMFAMPG